MYQALYRKWRPKDFESVCGQEHITSVLRYEIINNRYSHAYLFCGSRGTGKTTCAKLLAKAVNCLSPENGSPCGKCEACLAIENETTTDVVEMDAASMMVDLLFMVAIPAVIAMSLHQKTHGRVKTTLKPRLEPFSKLALLLLITINATGCASFLRDIDRTLILVIVSLISLCLFAFFLGYWAGRALRLPFPSVLSTSMVSGSRNISAGAVLAAQYFPAEVMFPVAFSPLFFQIVMSLVVKALLSTKPGKAWQAAQGEEVISLIHPCAANAAHFFCPFSFLRQFPPNFFPVPGYNGADWKEVNLCHPQKKFRCCNCPSMISARIPGSPARSLPRMVCENWRRPSSATASFNR